jgi:hypothetical protein
MRLRIESAFTIKVCEQSHGLDAVIRVAPEFGVDEQAGQLIRMLRSEI